MRHFGTEALFRITAGIGYLLEMNSFRKLTRLSNYTVKQANTLTELVKDNSWEKCYKI